jgi:hypothetical protein
MTTAKTQDEFPGGEHAQDDAWEALTRGELSREEEAFLRALAEDNDADGARLEAHAPLDAGFRERTAEKLEAQLARERKQRQLKVRVALSWGAASLAVAAAALFIMLPGGRELPEYTLMVEGSVAQARGADQPRSGMLQVLPQSELEIVLAPSSIVQVEPVLTVALASDASTLLVQKAAERAPSGAFRLQGTLAELFGSVSPGRYELLAVVDRQAVPAEELVARARRGDPAVEKAELRYEAAIEP